MKTLQKSEGGKTKSELKLKSDKKNKIKKIKRV
jgi:hypothetical protein